MKNYLEKGLEIFNDVFNNKEIFESVIKWGEYVMTEEFGKSKNLSKYKECEKAKLILTQPLEIRKQYNKGSFVYGYILNEKQLIYVGQCSGTSRINAPSSVGGFNKVTRKEEVPSKRHGKTNVKLFLEINQLIYEGNKIEIFIVKAKEKETEDGWNVKYDEKQMEKRLLNKFEEVHNQQPLLNKNNDQKCYQL
jgi:hypothetical protein